MTDQQVAKKEKASKAPKPVKHSSSRSQLAIVLAVFVLIIAVIALIIAGENWHRAEAFNQSLAQAGVKVGQLTAQNNKLTSSLKQTNNKLAAQAATLKMNQATLARLVDSLSSNHSSWLIADAEHLMKLANVTLHFSDNVPTTILLLETADDRLASTDNPALYPVRKLLAEEVVALQAVPKVDRAGLFLKLQALSKATVKLPLVINSYQQDKVDNLLGKSTAAKQSIWQRAWHSFDKALSKVLIIRKRHKQVEPLISPKQHVVLQQNIALIYSQAQWAALHKQPEVYQASLQQLVKLIPEYFVPDNKTQAIQAELQKLLKVNVAPSLPNISASLTALQNYKQQQQKDLLLGTASKQTNTAKKVKATKVTK
jgi:uroporphyrin-3 C-methyltransferase